MKSRLCPVLVLALLLLCFSVSPAAAQRDSLPDFRTTDTSPTRAYRSVVTFPDFLQARKVATLSSQVDAVVRGLHAHPGDFVAKDDLLVQFDDDIYTISLQAVQVRLELNELDLAEARVRNQYAQDNLRITQQLYDNDVGGIPVSSEKELKEARQNKELSEIAVHRAELEKTNITLEKQRIEKEIQRHQIRAPWNGVVVPFSTISDKYLQGQEPKALQVGETVQRGRPAFALMQVDVLRVSHWLSMTQLDKISLGQEVHVHVMNHPDNPISARIVYISPTINPHSQFNIEVEFENPLRADHDTLADDTYPYQLRDGMPARVSLNIETEAQPQEND